MRKAGPISKSTAYVALMFSLVAFLVGSGPFSPGLILAVVALPIAVVTAFFGPWRLSLLAIYWAFASFSAVPISKILPIYTDGALVLLGVVGLALSAVLYFHYAHTKSIA